MHPASTSTPSAPAEARSRGSARGTLCAWVPAAPAPGQIFGVMKVCFMTAPTRDGRFIQMCSRQPHLYRNWLKAMRLEALLDAPDLEHMPDLFPSEERLQEVVDLIEARMREKTADEWM